MKKYANKKPKKVQKKGPLMRKADTLCSKYWREKIGRCERQGQGCRDGRKATLQMAHINTRDVRGLRYDRRNLLCLCASCHAWGHDYPTQFTEFVKKVKTKEDYQYIHTYKSQPGISTIEFYKKHITHYQNKIIKR
jgi:hypothetical protein